MQRIAQGVNVLSHRATTEFADDYLNFDQGLERARSGVKLEEEFHHLVQTASDIVNTEAFLIAFDDVDTEFNEGWRILELIRRYLQTPRLVVLITGDMQLYTHLVRRRQFENFGDSLHQQDGQRSVERVRMIDHIEQQYLLKLFPLQNRVELKTLSQLSESNGGEVRFYVKHSKIEEYFKSANSIPLIRLLSQIVRDGLNVVDSRNNIQYCQYLLGLPIRAILQILHVYCDSLDSDNKAEILARALRGTLLGSLYQSGINVDALTGGSQSNLIESVFDVVKLDGEFDTGSYLRPHPGSETLRDAFVSLAAEVAAQCNRRPDRALRYLLQGPGSLTLARLHMPTNGGDLQNFFAAFKQGLSIGRNEDALNWARYATPALLNPYRDPDGVGPGVLRITGRRNKAANSKSLRSNQVVAFQIIRHNVLTKSSYTYLSIFNTIGVIEKLLSLSRDESVNLDEELKAHLLKMLSAVTITAPSWIAGREEYSKTTIEDFSEVRTDFSDEESVTEMVPVLSRWLRSSSQLSQEFMPSALLLGKIWTRLYFSLARAQSTVRKRALGVGSAMHLYFMCLINACLVEELDYAPSAVLIREELTISRNNPLLSGMPVFRKLRILYSSGVQLAEVLPLTNLILTCPLVNVFLPMPEELGRPLSVHTNVLYSLLDCDEVGYNELVHGLEVLNDERIVGSRRDID
ncbi:hypothetical protein NM04_17445 [Massilia aurea]|uniref:KAP NTPase domain-containing protein n=1 Tax=Massilia aurea TaxID=373040 RepID=A0A422QHV8_9BURK|nr:hypothetical protein NM04_17445 [Massilia aurea]